MLRIPVGVSVLNNLYAGILWCLLFVLYINYFQILPEEQAMRELFPDEFMDHQKTFRRWL